MYDGLVYMQMRKESPGSFDIAEKLYDGVLNREMLVVRALITRAPKDRMYEIARIHIIDHERLYSPLDNAAGRDVLLHLEFRAEVNLQENKFKMLETSLEVHGPRWNEKPLEREDMVNHLGAIIYGWSEIKALVLNGKVISSAWSSSGSFVGCLALLNGARTDVRAYHPYLLPYITMCFGSLHSSIQEKTRVATEVLSTHWSAMSRKDAIDSFLNRFGSFVAQAKRGSVRDIFGSFFAS